MLTLLGQRQHINALTGRHTSNAQPSYTAQQIRPLHLVLLEFGDHVLEQRIVKVLAAQERVAVGCLDLSSKQTTFALPSQAWVTTCLTSDMPQQSDRL